MLACLRELAALVLDFVEQPHVLDGDHRLVGEGGDQLDLLVGEWPHRARVHQEMTPIGVPSRSSGTPSTGAKAATLCCFGPGVFRIGRDVGNMNGLAFQHGSSDERCLDPARIG